MFSANSCSFPLDPEKTVFIPTSVTSTAYIPTVYCQRVTNLTTKQEDSSLEAEGKN